MGLGPDRALEAAVVAQQQLAYPVPGAHQIAADILPCADQVAQRLLARRGHPHGVQLARDQQPHEQLRVAAIRLYAVLRGSGDLARRCNQAAHPGSLERPGQAEVGRARLEGPTRRRWRRRTELDHPPRSPPDETASPAHMV